MDLRTPFRFALQRNRLRLSDPPDPGDLSVSMPLLLRPHAFLNQLLHFDRPRLILRNPGISLCRETEFGVFFRGTGSAGEAVLADPVSGLQIDASEIGAIHFIGEGEAPPTFEIHFRGTDNVMEVQPQGRGQTRLVIDRILHSFADEAAGAVGHTESTAARWLDELNLPTVSGSTDFGRASWRTEFEESPDGTLRIQMKEPGFRFEGTLLPWRTDRDGPVLRFWDREARTVVYLDTRHVEIDSARLPVIAGLHHGQPVR